MCLFLLCLLSACAFAQPPAPARITVFREKDGGSGFITAYQQLFYQNREWVDSRYRFSLFLDEANVATFRVGRFVTFEVPPGQHVIRTKRSEPITLDLKPGEHVFVRPGLYSKVFTALRQPETIDRISSCREVAALVGGQTLAPSKSKDLHAGAISNEPSFPMCSQ